MLNLNGAKSIRINITGIIILYRSKTFKTWNKKREDGWEKEQKLNKLTRILQNTIRGITNWTYEFNQQ